MHFDYHIDLFSGIGGFALGFDRAGWQIKNHYYSEIDKYAIQVYRKQFQQAEVAGAMNCKNNSPSWQFDSGTTLIQEGVQGNNDAYCLDAGYGKMDYRMDKCKRQLIQVAQIGEKDGGGQGAKTGLYVIDNLKGGDGHDTDNIYSTDGIAPTLRAERGGKGGKTGLYEVIQKPQGNNKGGTKGLPNLTTSSCEHNQFISNKTSIRRLTPIECERLQGFPDNWTQTGIDDNGKEVLISDTQRYRQLGNAISVPIVKLIASKLKGE